jgi:hypothetical protein
VTFYSLSCRAGVWHGGGSVNLDQLFALQQAELFLSHTRLRAYSGPGMLATAIAMTMAGLKERRIDFKAHAAAQTTAANELVH